MYKTVKTVLCTYRDKGKSFASVDRAQTLVQFSYLLTAAVSSVEKAEAGHTFVMTALLDGPT